MGGRWKHGSISRDLDLPLRCGIDFLYSSFPLRHVCALYVKGKKFEGGRVVFFFGEGGIFGGEVGIFLGGGENFLGIIIFVGGNEGFFKVGEGREGGFYWGE